MKVNELPLMKFIKHTFIAIKSVIYQIFDIISLNAAANSIFPYLRKKIHLLCNQASLFRLWKISVIINNPFHSHLTINYKLQCNASHKPHKIFHYGELFDELNNFFFWCRDQSFYDVVVSHKTVKLWCGVKCMMLRRTKAHTRKVHQDNAELFDSRIKPFPLL